MFLALTSLGADWSSNKGTADVTCVLAVVTGHAQHKGRKSTSCMQAAHTTVHFTVMHAGSKSSL